MLKEDTQPCVPTFEVLLREGFLNYEMKVVCLKSVESHKHEAKPSVSVNPNTSEKILYKKSVKSVSIRAQRSVCS